MNDENMRFLLGRMDAMEQRLAEKIEELQEFKNKLLGLAVLAGGAGSFIIELVLKKFT